MSYTTPAPTSTLHRKTYPAISTSRPELSQSSRNILITGSSGGIGFSIARGFAEAGSKTIVLTGRSSDTLASAVATLEAEFPNTAFIGKQIDTADTAALRQIFKEFAAKGFFIDVLILNAALTQQKPILELGYAGVAAEFTTNVLSNMLLIDLLYHQPNRDKSKKLAVIYMSSMAVHDFRVSTFFPNYSVVKSAGTMLLQQIARDVDPNDMQLVSVHPGAIFTGGAKRAGLKETTYNWDEDNLPSHFAVWAASDEAKFLHGRFLWCAWDVPELLSGEARKRIDADSNYLKIGVTGL